MVELVDCRVNNKYRNWGIAVLLIFVFSLYTSIYFVRKIRENRTDIEKRYLTKPKISDEFILISANASEKVIVKALSGSLEGKKLIFFSSTTNVFLGIPYAEPPIGELRFSSPEPVKPWTGIRQAFKFSPMCSQIVFPREIVRTNYISDQISEDCLTLNIWTPDVEPKKLKTVMVWIHGGDFNYNSANLHETDGRVLSTFGDVVVVTVNYRVGVFGFLNTRTKGAPGNMGLYDQTLALHWIKDNIKRFGGDPEKIVPFGESAGAISIGFLMTYNKTRDLFSRAITQSGSFLMPQSNKTFEYSVKLTKLVDCLNDQNKVKFQSFTEEEIECLKNVPSNELLEASKSFLDKTFMPFMPSIDSYYEDIESPMNYIKEENAFSNVKEMMSGIVKDEGTFFLRMMNSELFKKHSYPQLKTLAETRQMFIDLAKNKTDFPEEMISMVANSFIDGPERDSPNNNIERLAHALGDFLIKCPTIYLADEMVARNKSVYMYLFNHRPKTNKFGEWLGVMHYEEVPYIFGYPLRNPELHSKLDIILAERMMQIWSHFAKTGKVLPQLDLFWPKYSEENSFMVLHPIQSSIISSLNSKSCEMFKSLIKVNGR